MADIDSVLERLVTDAAFRNQLGSDPAAALAGYDLSADDIQLLASSMDDGDSAERGVEQRTSKSAVLGLLASFTGGTTGGGRGMEDDRPPTHDAGSKDTGFLQGSDAPGDTDVAGRKGPGRPKVGEISVSKLVSTGDESGTAGVSAGADAAPVDDTAVHKVIGNRKWSNIVLKRGADTTSIEPEVAPLSNDVEPSLAFKDKTGASDASAGKGAGGADRTMDPSNAAPAGDGTDPTLAFKQGYPVKWEGPTLNATGNEVSMEDLAAPGDTEVPELGEIKLGTDGARKVEIGSLKAGDTSVDDFLTIEDA